MARRKRKYSRLARHEKKKYARQTTIYTVLTVLLLIAIVFWGIPSLVRVAIFLGDIRTSNQPISGKDTISPSPPILQTIQSATSSSTIRVGGFAEEGSSVILYLDGKQTQEAVVESDGEFLFNKVRLKSGENEIHAVAIDSSGNESQKSAVHSIELDTTAPELVIESPSEGATFYGATEKKIRIIGSTDAGVQLLVNGSFVILSRDGTFSHLFSLNSGENEINIVAKDRAGNETEEIRTVTFEE